MSYIFDGLQRREGEVLGTNVPERANVTELIESAEHRSRLQWEGRLLSARAEGRKSGTAEVSTDREEAVRVVRRGEESTVAEPSAAGEQFRLLQQFESIPALLHDQSRLICLTERDSPAAEAFRLLGVRLRHLRRERQLKTILITSTCPQEGKSMIAANLACTLALKPEQPTLLLEGDLRRPALLPMFGVGQNVGLRECLGRQRSLAANVYRIDGPNVWVLPAGTEPGNALEFLQSTRLSPLIDHLANLFEWIIIDSPPMLPLADASIWTRLADGVILITRQGTTERKKLQRALEAIDHQKLIGVVVNGSSAPGKSDDYSYGPSPVLK